MPLTLIVRNTGSAPNHTAHDRFTLTAFVGGERASLNLGKLLPGEGVVYRLDVPVGSVEGTQSIEVQVRSKLCSIDMANGDATTRHRYRVGRVQVTASAPAGGFAPIPPGSYPLGSDQAIRDLLARFGLRAR